MKIYILFIHLLLFFYIKPNVVKIGLPPYKTHCFLRRFEDLIYLLMNRGLSNHLLVYRCCRCNIFNYVESEYQDCCHEQLRTTFLMSIKDIFTKFHLFITLWNEKISSRHDEIYFQYPEKSIWEILLNLISSDTSHVYYTT